MINKYLKIIIVLLLVANATFAGNKIGIYDLRSTLQADLSTAQGLNLAWDDVHAVATLQGVVNRDTPRLYVYFVMEGNNDIDGYWWNKYSRKGEWLYGRETQKEWLFMMEMFLPPVMLPLLWLVLRIWLPFVTTILREVCMTVLWYTDRSYR